MGRVGRCCGGLASARSKAASRGPPDPPATWKSVLNNPDVATRFDLDQPRSASLADDETHASAALDAEEASPAEEAAALSIEDECAEDGAYDLCEPDEPVAPVSARGSSESPAAKTAEEEAEGAAVAAEGSSDLDASSAPKELRGWPRFEAWVERLAHKYKFIRKITSRLYLPIAFHSGLTMKKLDPHTFTYVLPFRRFNRNFYDAMAGAALVANSEIAAGMYLFGELGGKWTVVCKRISYRFLRPCLGPAIYKVNPLEDVKARIQEGLEFNIDLTLEILQQVTGRRTHPRVGRCEVTFHCAPKGPEGNRGLRRRRRRRLLK